MSSMNEQRDRLRNGERGSIIIMTAIFALLLLLMVGLCIDVSRIYVVRAELQNAADAAALTAARELNGGTDGIDNAVTQATTVIANNQGLRTKVNVGIAEITFATTLNGTYMTAATAKVQSLATISNIQFVKVTTQATSTNILFASSALGVSHAESREAVAGKSVDLSGICDFFPMAVALTNPAPAIGTQFTLTFTRGDGAKCPPTVGGSDAKLCDQEYIILEVPNITGNGTVETALLTAGLPNFCKKFGDNINMTPSSNQNNGPKNSGEGANTRMNGNLGNGVYPVGYANQLQPGTFPPDTNIQENITYTQYANGTAVTVPNPNGPGKAERRMLISPIITPGIYPNYTTSINHWGVFFIRNRALISQGNCDPLAGCGALQVEYVGKANVAATGPPACGSGLTTPVLYR
jgi:Flp pilus assembly protein TadG